MTRLYVQSVDAEAAIQNLKSLAKEISEEVLLRAAERAADEAIDEVRTKLQNNGFGVRPPKIATSERKLRKGSAFPFTSLVEFQHYALAWESYIEPMGKDMVRVVVTRLGHTLRQVSASLTSVGFWTWARDMRSPEGTSTRFESYFVTPC